ncbi:MAG: hypothetical protein ACLSGK_02315 [Lachnospiraceae bacterium]
MKEKISTFLFGLLFLIGFGILIYPTVSNQVEHLQTESADQQL